MLACIQPDIWHDAMIPGGATLRSFSFMIFIGNVTRGGIKLPPALIQG